tara:strand:- start:1388 stop:2038 length:651 start_codon:yes stop_codon:yes gene_type:complete
MIKLTKKKSVKIDENNDDKSEESAEIGADTLMQLLGATGGPESRSIMLQGNLEEENAADVVTALIVLSSQKNPETDEVDPIKFYISTYGGAADEMFAIYDVMNYVKRQGVIIETIGLGKVMSAGTLLLAAGTPGHRKLGKHTRVMIHAVAGGSMGELHSIKNELEQMSVLQDSYIQAMADETEMSKKQIQNLINRKVNVYLSASEAIEKGLADEVF